MARGNSALKSKMPAVRKGNQERALSTMMRVEGGQAEVLSDAGLHHWAEVPASAILPTLDLVGDGAWIPRPAKDKNGNTVEPGDDEMNLAFVINSIGVVYERLLDPPPEVAGLIDPVKWTRRACDSLKRAAGQSPRCALVEGDDGDAVCVVDYEGPALDLVTGEPIPGVTVFYPSICKYADPRSRLTGEPNMAREWISSLHPAQAMRAGVSRILYRVRKDLVVEELRKVNRTLVFEWSPDDIIPDLVAEPEDGPKRKYVWAGPVTVTRPDGTTIEIEAEEGVLTRKELIRTRQTEYLETGSKKLTRAAEEDAIALVYMEELLQYVRERDKPRKSTDAGKLTKCAAWLLFLNREDSLKEVKEFTEADLPEIAERAGKMATDRGLTQGDINPEKAAQRMARLTRNHHGSVGRIYGTLSPKAIWSEWRDMFVDAPPSPQLIKKAQAMLNEATDWYMARLAGSDTYERPQWTPPKDVPMDELLQELMDKINGTRS